MSDAQQKRATWISIIITVTIAIIGWMLLLTDKLSAASHNAVEQSITSEREQRISSDKALGDTLDRVVENTKDIPALVAEMKIVLGKLGLDGK